MRNLRCPECSVRVRGAGKTARYGVHTQATGCVDGHVQCVGFWVPASLCRKRVGRAAIQLQQYRWAVIARRNCSCWCCSICLKLDLSLWSIKCRRYWNIQINTTTAATTANNTSGNDNSNSNIYSHRLLQKEILVGVVDDILSLTAAAPSDSVFRALCTHSLTYLLTCWPFTARPPVPLQCVSMIRIWENGLAAVSFAARWLDIFNKCGVGVIFRIALTVFSFNALAMLTTRQFDVRWILRSKHFH